MIKIRRLVNEPVASNCYILTSSKAKGKCIIIDPGSESNEKLFCVLNHESLIPQYIILTHEHFDHCWGVNDLLVKYPKTVLIGNARCINAIGSEKHNCSVFYDNTTSFTIKAVHFNIVKNGDSIDWNNNIIRFMETPGHTKGSICIQIDNSIFTGDTVIPNVKTITKLPSGSKVDLFNSISSLKNLVGLNIKGFPGHGDIFDFDIEPLNVSLGEKK